MQTKAADPPTRDPARKVHDQTQGIQDRAGSLRERPAGRIRERGEDRRRGDLRHVDPRHGHGKLQRGDRDRDAAKALDNKLGNRPTLVGRGAEREYCLEQAAFAFAQNRFAEALSRYREAMLLGADPADLAAERWTCFMMLGRFDLAWRETDRTEERRKARGASMQDLALHLRRVWDGTPVAGKRVLVRCYHGLGDTIQFVRYIPMLSRAASGVILQPQESLVPLFSSLRETTRILSPDKRTNDFDVEVELMELPYVFRSSLENIPISVPYLHVPAEKVQLRRAELSELGLRAGMLSVGIVWSSGDWNPDRNIGLEDVRGLARIEGLRLFSLQRGEAPTGLSEYDGIVRTERESSTVLETAAAILNMDLIISVDTMVAHLAGALGKPVWLLLPFSADWRWMAERDDSPWYPTMRLFRQNRRGDWKRVIERVILKLLRLKNSETTVTDQTSCGSSGVFS